MGAAAVIMARRRRFLRAFYGAGALSPGTARSLAEVGQWDSRFFQQMVRQGIFVPVGDGRYYLDQVRWGQVATLQQKMALFTIGLVLVFIAVVLFLSHWIM